jgi:photosystem II stability/assembly factor-like uncharacterized protein
LSRLENQPGKEKSMKKQIAYPMFVLLLAGAALSGCGRSESVVSPTAESQPTDTQPAGSWQTVRSLENYPYINIAGFNTPDTGIALGYAGEVHYTTDGGQTWPIAENSSLCIFGLEIVDSTTAWHCGNGGDIRVSSDGGKTWQAAGSFGYNEPNHCRYMSFLDATTGWAASPSKLGRTGDGGKTWTELTLPEGIQKIASIDLRSPSIGYILDSTGAIFITQDGGMTWSPSSLDLASGVSLSIDPAPRSALRFVDSQHAVIVYTTKDRQLWSAWTADGGNTWEREQLEKKGALPAVFLSRDGKTLTITWANEITVYQSLR